MDLWIRSQDSEALTKVNMGVMFWKREKKWKRDWEFITYLQVIKPINDILRSDNL